MDVFSLLRRELPTLTLERNFSFAKHTTIGCGGTAAVSASPASEEEAAALLGLLMRHQIPYCFLGAGANSLPAEGEYSGCVVRFSRMTNVFCGEDFIQAEAGVTGGRLLRFSEIMGRGGLEFLTGIPMTVGGAVVMNAGVRGAHIGDFVLSVRAIIDGEAVTLPQNECGFKEKESIFQRGIAVLGARLKVSRRAREDILAARAKFRAARQALPAGRSMGCVFVNPKGISAGELIEKCGLKGTRCGGAAVSQRHANFIISEGAKAFEVASLIEYIKKTVYEKTGIRLREEIRRIP